MQFINRQPLFSYINAVSKFSPATKVKVGTGLRIVKRLFLIFSFVLFSACSFLGDTSPVSQTSDGQQNTTQGANSNGTLTDGKADGTKLGATAQPQVVVPKENPYLTNRPPVSAADQQLFSRALSAAKSEQWEQASDLFQALTKQNPALSGPYLNLGVIAQKQDQLAQAEMWFKKAIEVNTNNLDAYTALALLYKNQAKFTEAKELLTQAVTIWPLYPAGHRNLGILNEFYLGDFKSALKHYKTYQSLLDKPDRKIKGWIIDLERRIPSDPEEPAVVAESTDAASKPETEVEIEGEGGAEEETELDTGVESGGSEDVVNSSETDPSIESENDITTGDSATETEVSDNESQ